MTSGSRSKSQPLYTSRIIKASALLADTKTLLSAWDLSKSVEENLSAAKSGNIFGKSSRSRVEDILAIFRSRYLQDPSVTRALVTLANDGLSSQSVNAILYFYSARADRLLYDTVTLVLEPLRSSGHREVGVGDIERALYSWMDEGAIGTRWSEMTTQRVASGLLTTLRDFGVLQGKAAKTLAPVYLPIDAFAYIAFEISRTQPAGEQLVHHADWSLFFLTPDLVERDFIEAHQQHLLGYYAAGRTIRVEFPADTREEYAHALTQR